MFTLVRRLSRTINIRGANIVLYTGLLLLSAFYYRELYWSCENLYRYWTGEIGMAHETRLYKWAKNQIQKDQRTTRTRELLEESILIDPNSEALYWLGEYYYQEGDDVRALELFKAYLKIDPTRGEAYLRLADLYARISRREQAKRVLGQGIQFYKERLRQSEPRPNHTVKRKYNEKAARVYAKMQKDLLSLKQALRTLK